MHEQWPAAIGLRHLRCFVAVAEAGSFAAAAARLHLAPSALTATIKRLEAETGVTLFDRTTRRVVLTRHGAEFLPEAQRLLHGFARALADLGAAGGLRRGQVAVAAAPALVTRLLPAVVRAFRAAHPAIEVTIRDDGAEGIGRRVAQGEADFGLGSRWARDPALDFRPLLRDRFGIVGRSDDPLLAGAAGRALPWSALAGREIVALTRDTGIQAQLAQGPRLPPGIEPRLAVSNTLGLLAMVEAGLGLAVMPEVAATLPGAAALLFVPLARPAVRREIGLITRRGRAPTPAARVFLELVLERLRATPLAPGVQVLA